jgi:hypothetical protein
LEAVDGLALTPGENRLSAAEPRAELTIAGFSQFCQRNISRYSCLVHGTNA